MSLTPDFETFSKAYSAGRNQIVYTRLAADLDTPVSLMLKLTGAAENAFELLAEVTGHSKPRFRLGFDVERGVGEADRAQPGFHVFFAHRFDVEAQRAVERACRDVHEVHTSDNLVARGDFQDCAFLKGLDLSERLCRLREEDASGEA